MFGVLLGVGVLEFELPELDVDPSQVIHDFSGAFGSFVDVSNVRGHRWRVEAQALLDGVQGEIGVDLVAIVFSKSFVGVLGELVGEHRQMAAQLEVDEASELAGLGEHESTFRGRGSITCPAFFANAITETPM